MQSLAPFLHPNGVVFVGATDKEGSVGRAIVENLLNLEGRLYLINPKRREVLGHPCLHTIDEIDQPIDLAVIAIKAELVPKTLIELGKKRILSVIIISAGFKEAGEEGIELEREILEIAKQYGIRIIGPNCLGVMSPYSNLNATFASNMALAGGVAFISQSGAMCTAMLDYANDIGVGFSAFISVGSMSDIEFKDCIEYLGNDPKTHTIFLYMETIGTPEGFVKICRNASLKKPIIAIKPGRSEAARNAAASHTGSLVGSDTAVEAIFDKGLILRAETMEEFFDLFTFYALEETPHGDRIGIITNAGGMGVLTTDAIELNGAKSVPPIDVLGDATEKEFAAAWESIKNSNSIDALITIASPQSMTDFVKIAEINKEIRGKIPQCVSFVGKKQTKEGVKFLTKNHIPHFSTPDRAAKVLAKVIGQKKKVDKALNTPSLMNEIFPKKVSLPHTKGRTLLTEYESKNLLERAGLPVVKTLLAHTQQEAIQAALEIGFPVVVKLNSTLITHKSDVGGVKLNLQSTEEVAQAYNEIEENIKEGFEGVTVQKMCNTKGGIELLFGMFLDPSSGPMISFGSGGIAVELYKDVTFVIPPVSPQEALDIFTKTHINEALKGYRNLGPVDRQKLAEYFSLFSTFIASMPEIEELDINPFIATKTEMVILDARIVIKKH
ncbi:MAG: acetate--CoA ligase family protein [Chlamydiia bacterium]